MGLRWAWIALASMCCLCGCATRCFDQTYYKPIAADGANLGYGSTEQSMLFNLGKVGYVELEECGWARRDANNGPVILCVNVIPDAGVIVEMKSPDVEFFARDGVLIGTSHFGDWRSADGAIYSEVKSVAPSGAIRGETTKHRIIALTHMSSLVPYASAAPFPPTSASDVLVKLKPFNVQSTEVQIPTTHFQRVRGSICVQSY